MSSYPQHGRPLAAPQLEELLQEPLGDDLAAHGFAFYADLDATVWTKFSNEICEALGEHLAGHVQQQILGGLPLFIKERRVGPLPYLASLEDMNLDTRTSNCLKRAGFHRDPQLLEEATVGELVSLRNFGAKSLLNLLSAAEYVRLRVATGSMEEALSASDFSAEIERRRTNIEEVLTQLRERHFFSAPKYPRPGHPLAPRVLKEVLTQKVKVEQRPTSLSDLDEMIWSRLDPTKCRQLAERIINDVTNSIGQLPPIVASRRLGLFPAPVPLSSLGLDTRTLNALTRAGIVSLKDLETVSVQELVDQPSFGARSLLDLLTAVQLIQNLDSRSTERNGNLTRWARRIVSHRPAAKISAEDPRFGFFVGRLSPDAQTLRGAVEPLLRRERDPWNPDELVDALRECDRALKRSQGLRLEEELTELVGARSTRDREIILRYLGWPYGPVTLQEVGDSYGITRERVRQIVSRFHDRVKAKTVYAPVLDRTLAYVIKKAPIAEADLSVLLRDKGLTQENPTASSLIAIAEVLGRQTKFVVLETPKGATVVARHVSDLVSPIVEIARKSVEHWGVTTVADVAGQAREQGLSVDDESALNALESGSTVAWLDEPTGWFWLPTVPRNRLLNQIRKILAVAESVSVSELRSGVGRWHRMKGFAPPTRVLLELCRQATGFRVEGNLVIDDPPLDPGLLGDVERTLMEVLTEKGPLLTGKQLEKECVSRGMNRSTFYVYLGYSPIIARYARGVYGLRGADIQPGQAESLIPPKKRTRVVQDFGWRDGDVWISYRLSESMVTSGVAHIPSAMSDKVQGEWLLNAEDGATVGRLTIRGTSAWGFGSFFRRRGGEPGDTLLLLLCPEKREATIDVGGEDLLDAFDRTGDAARV